MKKFISLLTAAALILPTGAMAAYNPDYIYDYYPERSEKPVEKTDRGGIRLPWDSKAFEYSFSGGDKYYSDFIFSPVIDGTEMYIAYETSEKEHSLKIEVGRVADPEPKIVRTEVVTVTKEQNKIVIPTDKFDKLGIWFVAVSEPEIDGKPAPEATGKITVSGYAEYDGAKVTRGDFAASLAALIKDKAPAEAVEGFDDVDAASDCYEGVTMLKGLGIVKGTGDNLFNPNGEITYAEAFNMAARLFKTEEEIAALADYPLGAALAIPSLGFTLGVSVSLSETVTKTDMETMLENISKNADKMREL